ncbi:Conserved_hypothetical protein [Hexamita inflata]|uniref:Uncharacterized protein n=1 Tax=Hexamita inflata TaxID=28002 RepID=A0AA86VSF1_9EUKA|nr:Conserved hypothetical protein [Hexamita inflata]
MENLIKPSLFVIKETSKILIQSGIYAAFINLNDKRQLEEIEQNDIIFLNFIDQDSETFFEKYNALEIKQESIVFVIKKLLLNEIDSIAEYYFDENQYLVPVEDQLIDLVQKAEAELEE